MDHGQPLDGNARPDAPRVDQPTVGGVVAEQLPPVYYELETARNERHARPAKGEPGRTASGPRRMAMAGRASACGSAAGRGGGGLTWAAAALDAVTASLCGLLASVQHKQSEMKANRDELRQGRPEF